MSAKSEARQRRGRPETQQSRTSRAVERAAALCGVSPTGNIWMWPPGHLQMYKAASIEAALYRRSKADAPIWREAFGRELDRRNAGREADIARIANRVGDFTGYRH